jgi:hypothetical protein
MTARVRKIILMTDIISVDQERAFIDWLTSRGMGWARWLSGGWLLNSFPDQPGVLEVRTQFLQAAPNTQLLAFEVEVADWAAWLNTQSIKPAAAWLGGQWGLPAAPSPIPQHPLLIPPAGNSKSR